MAITSLCTDALMAFIVQLIGTSLFSGKTPLPAA